MVAKRSGGTRKKNQPSKSSKVTWAETFRDVSIRLIDVFYKLCNSGNLLGAIILFVFVLLFYLSYKLDPAQVNDHLLWIRHLLYSERYYLFPLIITIAFLLYASNKFSQVTRKEIKRLSETRKNLMHGLNSGKLKELEDHSTSHFDIEGED